MAFSLCEYVAEHFYRAEKWLIKKDVPILPSQGKQHWSDLDILAFNGKEIHLVNCKDFLNKSEETTKIIKNLEVAEEYLRKEYRDIFTEARSVAKFYIYLETNSQANKALSSNGITPICLETIFCKYIVSVDKFLCRLNEGRPDIKKGLRYYRVGNLEGLDKMVAYMLNYSLMNDSEIEKVSGKKLSKQR